MLFFKLVSLSHLLFTLSYISLLLKFQVDLPRLRPGVYMVMCATFTAGQRGPFELAVFANTSGVIVDQVYPPVWRAGGGGGGGASAEVAAEAMPLEEED